MSFLDKVTFSESSLIPDGEIGYQRETDEEEAFDSLFSDVNLDEGSLMLKEGEQKERYLADKHGKKADELKAERERKEKRYGNSHTGYVGGDKTKRPDFMKFSRSEKDKENHEKTDKIKDKSIDVANRYAHNRLDEKQKGKSKWTSGYDPENRDAIERHERRHPKKESGMFSDVEFEESSMLNTKPGYRSAVYKTQIK